MTGLSASVSRRECCLTAATKAATYLIYGERVQEIESEVRAAAESEREQGGARDLNDEPKWSTVFGRVLLGI